MLTPGLPQVNKELFSRETLKSIFLLLIGLRKYLRVYGDSMNPTIKHGDLIIYQIIKSNKRLIKEGSLVVLNNPLKEETLIIKRVVNQESVAVELRGDNEEISTDSRTFGLVNKNQIVGVVKQIFPKSIS